MSEPIEADEVIPPSAQGLPVNAPGKTKQERHATARIMARWLDELLHIPGTKFKIGLDPFIALVPGVGDFLSTSVSAVVILESIRKGVSPSVVGRMGINVAINSICDAVPLAGPFFSAFFKSNSRNLALLHRWESGEQKAVVKGSRYVLMGIVIVLFVAFFCVMLFWAFFLWSLVASLWHFLSLLIGL